MVKLPRKVVLGDGLILNVCYCTYRGNRGEYPAKTTNKHKHYMYYNKTQ